MINKWDLCRKETGLWEETKCLRQYQTERKRGHLIAASTWNDSTNSAANILKSASNGSRFRAFLVSHFLLSFGTQPSYIAEDS